MLLHHFRLRYMGNARYCPILSHYLRQLTPHLFYYQMNRYLFLSLKPNYAQPLTFQRYAYFRHLTSQWWGDFSYSTLHFANLWKTKVQSIYDVLCHSLDGVLCALHLLTHNLIYSQIVYRFGNIVS